MRPPILEVTNITKSLNGKSILESVTFNADRGEIVGLLGPNGAGKTSLLYVLLGLLKPDRGMVKMFSLPLEQNQKKILQKINFATTANKLNGYSTPYENLITFCRLYSVSNPKQKIFTILSQLNGQNLLTTSVKTFRLSHGEQAKINLCKALLNDPTILFLDEISSALDHTTRELFYKMLLKMKKSGKIILFASHIEDEMLELCDKILILNKGKLVYEGSAITQKKLYAFYK